MAPVNSPVRLKSTMRRAVSVVERGHMRGQFITLEGSEGAGKSTNVDSVCAILDSAGIDYLRTREPGGTPMAEALRDSMLHKWEEQVNPLAELLLVFAARAQHLENARLH